MIETIAPNPSQIQVSPPASRRFKARPLGIVSVAFLLVVIVAVAAAPILAPYGPLEQQLTQALQLPSTRHLLGTDTLGRDVLSRLLYGGQPALLGASLATAVTTFLGIVLGLLAGYFGGMTDRWISAVVNILVALPNIVVVFAVLALFDNNLSAAMLSAGIFGSAGLVRVVRAATKSAREELYVAAARVSGVSPIRILGRHILPRLISPIVVQVSIYFGVALVLQSGLGFLNLGVSAPSPSWGGMVGEGASVVQQFPWLLVPSGAAIGLTVLACGLLGDSLRDQNTQRISRSGGMRVRKQRPDRERTRTQAVPVESTALLEVTDLDISFRNAAGWQPIVQGVSFSINPGELVGLVGESGSGKTVTALSLLDLLPENARVASTRTFFKGRDLRGAKESTYREIRGKGIALISQEPMVALDPAFTIGNQIVEVLRVTRSGSRSELRQHALELLRDVQLPQPETTMGSYAHQISGGMAQRVAIAFALAGNPQILIADEPTTALDVTVQAEILDLLRRLRDEHGMAVILVTHDLGVVADFCERVLVMQHGRIVERGTSDALFDSPQNAYTQALIRATPSLIELPTTQEPPESTPERKSL